MQQPDYYNEKVKLTNAWYNWLVFYNNISEEKQEKFDDIVKMDIGEIGLYETPTTVVEKFLLIWAGDPEIQSFFNGYTPEMLNVIVATINEGGKNFDMLVQKIQYSWERQSFGHMADQWFFGDNDREDTSVSADAETILGNDGNLAEIEKHKKLQRDAENKLNSLPVTKFGGAKNQDKADELARTAAFHESKWRELSKAEVAPPIVDDVNGEDDFEPGYNNSYTKRFNSLNGYEIFVSPSTRNRNATPSKDTFIVEWGTIDVSFYLKVKINPSGKIVSATNYDEDEVGYVDQIPDLQAKIIELFNIVAPARPNTGATFAAQLSKMTDVGQFKEFLGEQVLFMQSTKNLDYDELDSRKKGLFSNRLYAFRISPNGLVSYHEYASYCVAYMDAVSESFTEITGENNTYGPKKNISDERLLAFIKFNCKKNAKMTLRESIFDDALLAQLTGFVNEHKSQWKNASDLLKPLNETQKYKDARKTNSVPKSFVFYNGSSGTSEYRFELGGSLYSFNGGVYSTKPILEKQGKDIYDFLSGRFLEYSNYSPSNGYNESWSVYKASVSQKKELYKYFEAATVAYKNYVKLMQDWYSKLV